MTDPLDYDESTLSLVDEDGFSVTTQDEPMPNQAGVSPPGMLDALTDLINFGVSNGHFRKGPPDPSANITPAGSVSTASNFLPDWRFVQSSNVAVTASQVRDASSPSGSNLRFTFAAGAASDAAYVEQIIDVGGSRAKQSGDIIRGAGRLVTGANVGALLRLQYLNADGSIAGMPSEQVSTPFATSGTVDTVRWWSAVAPPPSSSRYLRLRVEAYRLSGSSAASLDVTDIRRDAGKPFLVIPDEDGVQNPAIVTNEGGRIIAAGGSGTAMINAALVPLTFVQTNIPAGTTAAMPLSDLGAPSVMDIPWSGSIVGVSYRMDGVLTAGTLAIRATVNGSNVWTAHSLSTADPQNAHATQAPGTDLFAAGDVLGIDLSSGGGFLPTTRDIVVTLWLALDYDGT